jgi:hypothetical protein
MTVELSHPEGVTPSTRGPVVGGGLGWLPGLTHGGKTSGVIELSEQTVIEQLVARLTNRYPAIAESTVASVVHAMYARFDDRPLRDFVPLFVERSARSELDRLDATAG